MDVIGSKPGEGFPPLESLLMLSKNTPLYQYNNNYNYNYNTNFLTYNMVQRQQQQDEEVEEEEEEEVTEIAEVVDNNNTPNSIGCDSFQSPLFRPESEPDSPVCVNRDQTSLMSVFPPINHEGLYISSFNTHHDHYPQFDRSLPAAHLEDDVINTPSPVLLDRPKSPAWSSYFGCKLSAIISAIRSYLISAGGGYRLSFRSPLVAAAVAMVVAVWYLRFRRQRRRRLEIRRESRDQLIRVIKEKDERITQLLRQIAQMNEILLGAQKLKGTT